jgi:proteasome alpha subunit
MITPYDWQEGIGHRAQYVENKLAQGAPVVALSVEEGILILTYRRTARKIYEVYDRLAFAAIGQQSDVEALRVAAIDFAHQEGFNRSEQDVTIQRVVTALSAPVKKAFSDFSTSPFVARSLFAEVADAPDQDTYAILDFDGDFATSNLFSCIAGDEETTAKLKAQLQEAASALINRKKGEKLLHDIWKSTLEEPGEAGMGGLIAEAVLVERTEVRENRFRQL